MKIKYPDTITVPLPSDFCKGTYTSMNNENQHCYAGWARIHFGFSMSSVIPHGLSRETWSRLCEASGVGAGSNFNDDPHTTFEMIAAAYERFLVLMGYEVTP